MSSRHIRSPSSILLLLCHLIYSSNEFIKRLFKDVQYFYFCLHKIYTLSHIIHYMENFTMFKVWSIKGIIQIWFCSIYRSIRWRLNRGGGDFIPVWQFYSYCIYSSLTTQISMFLSMLSNVYQTYDWIRLGKVYFLKYDNFKRLIWINDIFFPLCGRLKITRFSELAVTGASCRCTLEKITTNSSIHILVN